MAGTVWLQTRGSATRGGAPARWLLATLLWPVPLSAALPAAEEPDPPLGTFHVGARVGMAYDSNVHHNANADGDVLELVSVDAAGDLLPSEEVILKLAYRGGLEWYTDQSSFRHTAHLASLTGGYRPLDRLYVSLSAGTEYAHFPEDAQAAQPRDYAFSFLGAFGRAAARVEVGEMSTMEAGYRHRADRFPRSSLDNVSHTLDATLEVPVGDHLDLRLPLLFDHVRHTERFVQSELGKLTDEPRTAKRWIAEPSITVLPAYSLQLVGTVRGELNDSNGTYYFEYVDPTAGAGSEPLWAALVRRFDSYRAVSMLWSLSWTPVASLGTRAWANVGLRRFESRPPLDTLGLPSTDKQQDRWVDGGIELAWRPGCCFEIVGSYAYLRQWSNDSFWDFTRHRVDLLVGTWWGS